MDYTAESEATYDFFCEICIESGLNIEAEGYCVDCSDYLCKTCLTHHTRTRLTISHDVQDKDTMPKDKPLSYDKCSRIIDAKCKSHRGKTVEYYCKDHDFLACGTCIILGHRNCQNVEHIRDIPETFEQSDEFKNFEETMHLILQRSFDVIQQSGENINTAANSCKTTPLALQRLRETVNKALDELENNVIKQTETIKQGDIKAMKCVSDTVKALSVDVQKIISKVTKLRHSKKICQLYIAMRELTKELHCITLNLEKAENSNVVRLYDIEQSSMLQEMCKHAVSFGNIHFWPNERVSQIKPIGELKATTAIHVSDIDTSSEGKSSKYDITGSVILSRNKMMLVDCSNKVISLVDTNSNKLIHELKTDNQPWDVCAISEDQAVVTFRDDCFVLFLKISDVLSVNQKTMVSGKCRGIAYSRGMLVVTFVDPPKVEMIDLEGHAIKIIKDLILKWPQYVCLSNDEQSIYISDFKLNKVMRLTLNGDVMSSIDMKSARNVCVDQEGNVYAASHDNKTIHMFTMDCSEVKILLNEETGLTNCARSISYCKMTHRLFVGILGKSFIKVFQLH